MKYDLCFLQTTAPLLLTPTLWPHSHPLAVFCHVFLLANGNWDCQVGGYPNYGPLKGYKLLIYMNNGWNTDFCGVLISKYCIEIEAAFLLQCSKIVVEGLEFEKIGGWTWVAKLTHNWNTIWILIGFSLNFSFKYIYICKVVIYNYVLCCLYSMTKSVVITLIYFLVFCEILF